MDDVLCPVLPRLVAELRIGQLGSPHDDHIGLILFQDGFRLLRGVDPSHGDRRHLRLSSDPCGVLHIKASWNIDGRNLINGSGRDDISPGYIQYIHSIFPCHAAEFDDFFDGKPARQIIIVSVNTHEQRHFLRYGVADRPDTFKWESRPVLKASTVLIRPVV